MSQDDQVRRPDPNFDMAQVRPPGRNPFTGAMDAERRMLMAIIGLLVEERGGGITFQPDQLVSFNIDRIETLNTDVGLVIIRLKEDS